MRARRKWSCWALALVSALAGCGGGGGGGAPAIALEVRADTPAQVTLSWSAPDSFTQFDVYRDGTALYPTHVGGHVAVDFALQPATRYCYVVEAVQFPLGVVGRSNTACVATLPLAGWPSATIDADAAQAVALAFDALGSAHVALRAAGRIAYLTDAGGAWTRTTIHDDAGDFGDVAIAVDSARVVHLLWYDALRGVLRHARSASGAWQQQQIAAGGLRHAVALDADGRAHVAYRGDEAIGAPMMYATDTGGTWQVAWVDAGPVQRVAVGLDPAGVPRLAWASGDGLVCALWQAQRAAAWVATPALAPAPCPGAVSLDAAGALHAAYVVSGDGFALFHGSNAGGSWQAAQVDAFYWIPGEAMSIAMAADGTVHLAYTDHSALLKYARSAASEWRSAWVQAGARAPALRPGADGRVRIAYLGSPGAPAALRWTVQPTDAGP